MKVMIKRKCPACGCVDRNRHELKTEEEKLPPMLCWVCQTQGKQTLMEEAERIQEEIEE